MRGYGIAHGYNHCTSLISMHTNPRMNKENKKKIFNKNKSKTTEYLAINPNLFFSVVVKSVVVRNGREMLEKC